jgi:hypothetical protein
MIPTVAKNREAGCGRGRSCAGAKGEGGSRWGVGRGLDYGEQSRSLFWMARGWESGTIPPLPGPRTSPIDHPPTHPPTHTPSLLPAQGLGVEQDNATAIEFFKKGAATGHAPSQNGLGFM